MNDDAGTETVPSLGDQVKKAHSCLLSFVVLIEIPLEGGWIIYITHLTCNYNPHPPISLL